MEIVHVVAINPYRKGNKGKVFSYRMDTYDKVIESAAVKKMIQQIRGVYTNLKVYHFLIKKCTTPNRLQRYA